MQTAARLIPFGGGKGGVGKTFLVANLATSLARSGHKVLVVDGDLEGANLHTWMGVPRPPRSLADYAAGREADLRKLVVDTPVPHLSLIAATGSSSASPQPSRARRVELVQSLREMPVDFVLLDLGAGTHPAVMDYFMVVDDGVVVITPEPTSVENAYAFIRAAFYRRMRLAMVSLDVRKVVTLAMDQRNERGIHTPLDLLREIQAIDREEGARFVEVVHAFRPQLVLNEVRSADDIRLGFSMRSVCKKYFGIDAEYLGYVNHDEVARRAVRARRPLALLDERSDAASYIELIARKLAGQAARPVPAQPEEEAR
jgi:flagellar biosynthesis protein FlhG